MKAVSPLALVSANDAVSPANNLRRLLFGDRFKTNHLPDLLDRRVWQSSEIDEISPEFASIYRRGEDEECEDQGPSVF
jgi:hypothetical protein